MKKPLLAFAAIATLVTSQAVAQSSDDGETVQAPTEKAKPATRKGNIAIGSSLGLANTTYATYLSNSGRLTYDVQLSPTAGIFVTDHLLLSGTISGGAVKDYFYADYVYRHNGSNLGIGVTGRYYFGKSLKSDGDIKKLRFYAEAGVGYMRTWDKYANDWTGQTFKLSTSNVVARGGAGISYFLNPNAAFDAGLSYNRIFPTGYNPGYSTGSLQLQLGFKIFLNRK